MCGHVRSSVCHYYFVMLKCTIFILVHNDMESMVLFFKLLVNVVMQSNIKDFLCQFKKLVIILLVIFYDRLVLLYIYNFCTKFKSARRVCQLGIARDG